MDLDVIREAIEQVKIEINNIKESSPCEDEIIGLDHWGTFTHNRTPYDFNIWHDDKEDKLKASLFDTEPSDSNKKLLSTKVSSEHYLGGFTF